MELEAKKALPIQPTFAVNWLDGQCCLAGSSKTASRILNFSIAMGVDYSFPVKKLGDLGARIFQA